MANKVEICGVNTASLPRYKDKEMHDMLIAVKAGDAKVRDEFIKGESQTCTEHHSEVFRTWGKSRRSVSGRMCGPDKGVGQF